MIFYFIKRIILIIPTLFLISIVIFLLIDKMAGNVVQNEVSKMKWESADNSGSPNIKNYQDEIVKKYAFDKPLFYFSISNKALPDTLYKVFPTSKRYFLKHICQSYQARNTILDFLYSLDQDAKNNPEVNNLFLSHSETALEKKLLEFHDQKLISSVTLDLFKTLKKNHGVSLKYIPVFRWNGINNRYHYWIINFIRFDFGRSIYDGLPIREKVFPAIKISSQIGLTAIFMLFLIAVPIGIKLANSEKIIARLALNSLYVIQAMPLFWIAELLLVFLASKSFLFLFPSFGTGTSESLEIQYMILPVASMVISALPIVILQTKKTFEHYLGQPFVLTAKAKGLSEQKILWKHVFRNAITPVITLFFSFLPSAVAGVMIVEYVFSIPGAGRLLVEGISQQDYTLILTLILFIGLVKILSGILADISYRLSDPRVSF